MAFLDELEASDKKGIFKSDDNIVSYPTGITVLDYANGFWNETVDESGNKTLVPMLGITGGSMVSIIGQTGGGKALPNSTMIPTPNGYKRMGEINVGDLVFNRKGKSVKVQGVYPQGKKETYEVTFEDGRIARCSEDHLWDVYKGRTYKSETLSLKNILETFEKPIKLRREIISFKYSLPMNKPVEYPKRGTMVDPWAMGVIMMNWIKDRSDLTLVFRDKNILTKVADTLYCDYVPIKEDPFAYNFISKDDKRIIKTEELLDLSHRNKVPDMYKYNNIHNREEFLNGILSASGKYLNYRGNTITLTIDSVDFKNDIIDIARSLGCLVSAVKVHHHSINSNDKWIDERYQVQIKNAKFNIKENRLISYNPHRLIITDIKKLGIEEEHTCIYVEDPEHLFLTENYVVTHNTTLATQIGWNIVKNFEDGALIIVDCEKTNIRQRIANLTRTEYDEPRIKLMKSHTSIEDVLAIFNKICDLKESSGKKFMYEAKVGGRKFWTHVPTVFIIDSLPSFNSKEYNVEDLGNNIDQMKASKDITRFYTNVLDRAWKYNCIFLVINHIRPNTVMNPYAAPPPGLMMINTQTETLPRGTVAQYFSNTYFRIKSKKSAAYTVEDDGFNGYKCEISLAKTKTNIVGTSFPVTLNSSAGFDPIYSIYEFANSLGLIQGRNPYLWIQGFEDRKFNRKEFISMMSVDKEFREGVLRVLKPYYEALLGSKKNLEEEEETDNRFGYGDIDLEAI